MRLIPYCLLLLVPVAAPAQTPPTAGAGMLVREEVHSAALEGNLIGAPADQPVAIYLPPGYAEGTTRYPVLYLLHGIGGSPDDWLGGGYQGLELHATMDSLIGAGAIEPMIVVMPTGTKAARLDIHPSALLVALGRVRLDLGIGANPDADQPCVSLCDSHS